MKETNTKVTPEGLEGYMDDTHPYHEAVEITRVPDPVHMSSNVSHIKYKFNKFKFIYIFHDIHTHCQ